MMSKNQKDLFKEDIEHCISYACKEGYLAPEDVEHWTNKEKENYYDKCQSYNPED